MAVNLQPSKDLQKTFKKAAPASNLHTFTPYMYRGLGEGQRDSEGELQEVTLVLEPMKGNYNAPPWQRVRSLVKAIGRGWGFRLVTISVKEL
jgi:hypothetical protein